MRPIAALPLAMLLAACAATPPPIVTTRTVSGTPAEVRSRIEAAAPTLGLGADAGAGPSLQLSGAAPPAAWADCPVQVVRSHDDDHGVRADFAAPQSRAVTVPVSLAATGGGTSVSVTPRFTSTYRNIYRNLPFEGPCSSTGVLERTLLDAAG